ncbi:MAG TPA: ADOP family duplicated permease [Terriglobales bacterium]|nr:ADOP family duplicated permease [Terriglobales bacterium]
MSKLVGWIRRTIGIFRHRTRERELQAEIAATLDLALEDAGADGAAIARARWGSSETIRQACREQAGVPWLEGAAQDLRHAARLLRREPGFSLFTLLTLALALGAATAVFSADNAVLFRTLPYDRPQQLVELFSKYLPDSHESTMNVATANFLDWRAQARSFSGMAADRVTSFSLGSESGGRPAARVRAAEVSAGMFDVLGVRPLIGRGFQPGDDQLGAPPVAILSNPLWHSRYGGDPGVIGRTIRVIGGAGGAAGAEIGSAVTVVGVMPPGFRFPVGWLMTDVEMWTPLRWSATQRADRDTTDLEIVARLRPGLDTGAAQAEMDGIGRRLAALYPAADRNWGVNVMPLSERGRAALRPMLGLLSLAAGLMLALAAANVAGMLLARSWGRRHEIEIRMALGAGRTRVLRQLITEGVLLAAASGLAGLLVARWAMSLMALMAYMLGNLDLGNLALDGHALAFAALAALLVGIAIGAIPALALSRSASTGAMRQSGRIATSPHEERWKLLLVVAQVASALVLLTCALTLWRSFAAFLQTSPGFSGEQLTVLHLLAPVSRRAPEKLNAYVNGLLQAATTVPGIEVAVSNSAPMEMFGDTFRYSLPGARGNVDNTRPFVDYHVVGANYFAVTGMRLLRGEEFTAAMNAPVAVINDTLARASFGGESAVGQELLLRGDVNGAGNAGPGRAVRIVGVVDDVKEYGLHQTTPRQIFVPYDQDPRAGISMVVRSPLATAQWLPQLRLALASFAPDQPIFNIEAETHIMRQADAVVTFNAWLFLGFALLGEVLALAGIYALVAYAVRARMREFGVRLALGATHSTLLGSVLQRSAQLAGAGLVFGLLLAPAAARLLVGSLNSSLILHLTPATWPLFAAAALATLVAALVAGLPPALTAARTDPNVVLRLE